MTSCHGCAWHVPGKLFVRLQKKQQVNFLTEEEEKL